MLMLLMHVKEGESGVITRILNYGPPLGVIYIGSLNLDSRVNLYLLLLCSMTVGPRSFESCGRWSNIAEDPTGATNSLQGSFQLQAKVSISWELTDGTSSRGPLACFHLNCNVPLYMLESSALLFSGA
jgi:hypothetical protein